MKCAICAHTAQMEDAVALCPHCYVGLCLHHLAIAQLPTGPGGLAYGCQHQTVLRALLNNVAEHKALLAQGK
jgi:hypothetical protein